MATVLEELKQAQATLAARYRALVADSSLAGGKPDAGKSAVGHVAYRSQLFKELQELNKMIADEALNATGADATVFEIQSEAEI